MRRFAPSFSEHFARYAFATLFCYKRKVLDAGCKDGTCSYLLSAVANSLDLADISESFISAAKEQHKYLCPTGFYVADFNKEFPEGEWETITAFETIEHLENPDEFVKNVSEHLKEGGTFVFSVPHMIANKEHKTLFDEEKIRSLISKYLTIEEFYIQDRKAISQKPMYKGLKCYIGVARKL